MGQAACNPASIVPGIGFSPGRRFQGRLFSDGAARREIRLRHVGNSPKADPAHAARVAKTLDIPLSRVQKWDRPRN